MSGLKFLFTLLVIYFIFRSVMKKVVGAMTPDEGGGGLKGKLGDIINQVKDEIEKAKLEMEHEASTEEGDPWADFDLPDEAMRTSDSRYEEELMEEDPFYAQSRWDGERDEVSSWDDEEDEMVQVVAKEEPPTPPPSPQTPKTSKRRRSRLKEAVIWKEILDRPVGLR